MKNLFYLIFHFKFKELLLEDTEDTGIQFFRSLFVGGVATVVDFLVAWIALQVLSMENPELKTVIANSCGFVIGLVVNYLISILWVFKRQNMARSAEFLGFTLIGIIGLVINNVIVWAICKIAGSNSDIAVMGAKVVATLITLIWNFTARKVFLYGDKEKKR